MDVVDERSQSRLDEVRGVAQSLQEVRGQSCPQTQTNKLRSKQQQKGPVRTDGVLGPGGGQQGHGDLTEVIKDQEVQVPPEDQLRH